MKTTPLIVAAAVLGVGASAVAGTLAWSSSRTSSQLEAMVAASAESSDFKLSNLRHEAGLVGSRGSIDLELVSDCDDEPSSLRATIDYQVSHLPSPAGLQRFELNVRGSGRDDEPLRELTGNAPLLTGTGHVGFDARVSATLRMPELRIRRPGGGTRVAASSGELSMAGEALRLNWVVPDVTARGGDPAQLTKLALDLDLKNARVGTGTIRVSADRFESSEVAVEGVSFISETQQNGELIDSRATQSVRALKAMGREFRDLSLEIAVKGLHAPSLETVGRVASGSCAFARMTVAERDSLRDVIATLLRKGLSIGVPKLTMASDQGAVSADIELQLEPASGDAAATLATRLKSRGSLQLTGAMVDEQMRATALDNGWATQEGPQGLKASFTYASGRLSINGKPDESGAAAMIDTGLTVLDGALTALHPGR